MTKDEVVRRLARMNRAQIARDTGLNYMWLYDVKRGKIKEPGSIKMDKLRAYLISKDIEAGRPS